MSTLIHNRILHALNIIGRSEHEKLIPQFPQVIIELLITVHVSDKFHHKTCRTVIDHYILATNKKGNKAPHGIFFVLDNKPTLALQALRELKTPKPWRSIKIQSPICRLRTLGFLSLKGRVYHLTPKGLDILKHFTIK